MTDNTGFTDSGDNPSGAAALRRIFDYHAEETITDDQAQRVLEPVLKMIKEGKFDSPRRYP